MLWLCCVLAHGASNPDATDVGFGVGLGLFTSAVKVRALTAPAQRWVVGLDLDVTPGIYVIAAGNALVGLEWEQRRRRRVRSYLRAGGGYVIQGGLWSTYSAPTLHGGLGFEWKTSPGFGLGLEGGAFYVPREGDTVPYGNLTLMLYVR